ncbi:MAG TPA: YcaO-like family protein [Syntrophales bacterium]|nr:YcaO-like family protein [Syntrophobacterales bacterium]HRT27520.1 YcaO-like family protein [Syntrophales bacterium]HRT70430.1 YcaO-like family protein [Syntrophales bacterium]
MPGIMLKSCPKVYMLETHRSKTPADTLRFVERVKEATGMMSFRNATDVDRIGIQVFTCDRRRPDGSLTSHTGKGVSAIQAQVSITMEAIERYCSEFRQEYLEKLVKGPYRELRSRFNVLDPEEMILSQFNDYRPDKDIYWAWGYDIARKEDVLVPACAVYHPFHEDQTRLINTNTNGVAAGNTMEEAVIHGLAEVIERDAWSIAQYTRRFNDAIFIEDGPANEFIVGVLEKFERAGVEVVAKDLTTDVGMPVVAAFSQDLKYRTMAPVDGFGAHLDPRVATVRALLEIATTRVLLLQKYGIEGVCDTPPLYMRDCEEEEDPRFFAYDQKGINELEVGYSTDIYEDIMKVVAGLRACGLERVIAVDLTRPDMGIPTVRMVVPGMEAFCFDKTRIGRRAQTAFEDDPYR